MLKGFLPLSHVLIASVAPSKLDAQPISTLGRNGLRGHRCTRGKCRIWGSDGGSCKGASKGRKGVTGQGRLDTVTLNITAYRSRKLPALVLSCSPFLLLLDMGALRDGAGGFKCATLAASCVAGSLLPF